MMRLIVALVSGVIFGVGLSLSQMIDPNKVLNFFDVVGNWDPSLAFVMIGALTVTFIAFRFIQNRSVPILDSKFRLPVRTEVDIKLIVGAVLFGVGWGLSGYCPGPAVANLGSGYLSPIIFFIALLAGFLLHKLLFELSCFTMEKQSFQADRMTGQALKSNKTS